MSPCSLRSFTSARVPLPRSVAARWIAAALLCAPASAQVQFSIDWKSQSVSRPDSSSAPRPITEGDVLAPDQAPKLGPLAAPDVKVLGSELFLQGYPGCVGHPGGTPCAIEVDALSSGMDAEFRPSPLFRRRIWFSVDEWASGHPATPTSPVHATVFNQGNPTQGPVPTPGVFDAAADVFVDVNLPPGPIGPNFGLRNNSLALDGNGLASANGFRSPGLGLLEPRNTTLPFPYPGDNLDALEIGTDLASAPIVFFSLDSSFGDTLAGVANTGSALANGFVGGDVLRTNVAGTAVLRYANASQLGLDRFGVDTDDLDALVLAENGDGVYQRSQTPYDWLTGTKDMLVFSVRRGSAVVNQLDSIFGVPIQPGDLLVPPVAGGLSQNPGIFIAAEALGLRTERGSPSDVGDDLDAVDVTEEPCNGDELCFDCNENGVDDSVDIANGGSQDANLNGIPDECEDKVVEYCKCTSGSSAGCTNADANAGCSNSTGQGGKLESNINSGGSVSLALDNLVLTSSQLPTFVSGLTFMGTTSRPPATFYDGLRCINLPVLRYGTQSSGASGSFALGPGIAATAALRFGISGTITPGSTWHFQTWYRDPTGPCGTNSNVTNAVKVTFVP